MIEKEGMEAQTDLVKFRTARRVEEVLVVRRTDSKVLEPNTLLSLIGRFVWPSE